VHDLALGLHSRGSLCSPTRDNHHPFPALYPETNWPQAWSACAMFSLLQAMLGIYPYAPLNVLIVDPDLPDGSRRSR
jgi:glycogen debranching enzyme